MPADGTSTLETHHDAQTPKRPSLPTTPSPPALPRARTPEHSPL